MAEWQAYEQAFGPLDMSYERNALAHIAEQMELSNFLRGAEAEENPIPHPEHYKRPYELWVNPHKEPEEDPEEMSQAEFDKEFD